MSDSRVTVGILRAAIRVGSDDVRPFAQANFLFTRPSFQQLYPHTDRRRRTFYGSKHALGGIVGHELVETTDESPERVAVMQRMSTAYLQAALHQSSWPGARSAFSDRTAPIGRVDIK